MKVNALSLAGRSLGIELHGSYGSGQDGNVAVLLMKSAPSLAGWYQDLELAGVVSISMDDVTRWDRKMKRRSEWGQARSQRHEELLSARHAVLDGMQSRMILHQWEAALARMEGVLALGGHREMPKGDLSW